MSYIKFGTKKFSVRNIIVTIILAMLIYFEMIGGRSYFDEVLCLISVVYLTVLWINKKLSKRDGISLLILIMVITIGIISNINSQLNTSWFSIAVDIIAESKVLFVFFAAKYYINNSVIKDLSRVFTPIAQLFFLSAFVCSIISLFVNIGMTGSERYGLNGFKFIFPMSFQFLAVSMVMFVILMSNEKINNKYFYYIIGSISLMLALKSSPLLFGVFFLFLLLYFRKGKALNIRTIIILGVIIFLLGTYQIQTYLLNENAPRYLFFHYGKITANKYFPWGSGFATFGSDQAARMYSPLYYRYGFNKLFGMTVEDSSFLCDTFWAAAIGQFGWIGSILYIGIYIRIFMSINQHKGLSAAKKAFAYAGFIQYMIHAVGSAILSSSSGVIGFIALAMVLNEESYNSEKKYIAQSKAKSVNIYRKDKTG